MKFLRRLDSPGMLHPQELEYIVKEIYSSNSFGNRCLADDSENKTGSSTHNDDSDILSLIAKYDSRLNGCLIVHDENFYTIFDEISCKLLKIASYPRPKREFQFKLLESAKSYGPIMSNWAETFHKWLDLREQNIRNLQNSLKKFRAINKATTKITLVSSSLDFLLGIASVLHSFYHFNFKSTYPIAITVVSGVSITCSLIALSYSKQSLEDIARNFQKEKYLMRDLEVLYRKGNWNDKDLEELFPHGINLNLVKKHAFDVRGNLLQSWKQHVLTAILLTNIKKDRKLLSSEFLTSAKAFVESTAAQIWINRIRLRQLLDDMISKSENLPDRSTIQEKNGAFVNQAAVNLYPVIFPLFFNFRNMQKVKMLCSSVAAVTAAVNFTDSDEEDFDDLKSTCVTLQEDYKRFKKTIGSMFYSNEYD